VLPRLFHLGSFSVPTYGVLVATGVLVGLFIAAKLAQQQGEDPDKAWNLGILAVLSAIVGAKLLLIVNDWAYYTRNPRDIFSLSMLQAGGVFYGGLIAAIAVSVWYIRRNHIPVLKTCDAFAPGLALGHAIGRLGCFAAGCCYGKATSLPWGVVFKNPLAHEFSGTPLGVHIHPTQLYESAVELINFFILYWLFRHKRFHGQVIGAYMFLYGFARYFIEFVRADPERGNVFGIMTGTQLISLLLVVCGGLIWFFKGRVSAAPAVRPAASSSR
jgi:phosphatidylglycerol---prolipoprotein diacylglyceryl transferase